MMHDFKQLMPDMTIAGIEISRYAYEHAIEDMKPYISEVDPKIRTGG